MKVLAIYIEKHSACQAGRSMELSFPKHCPRCPLYPNEYNRSDFVSAAVKSIEINFSELSNSDKQSLLDSWFAFFLALEQLRASYVEQRRIGVDLFSLSEDSLLFLAHSVFDIYTRGLSRTEQTAAFQALKSGRFQPL